MIAKVEPLTTTRAVRGPFDYRLGSEHAAVAVGSLLRIRFGGRPLTGVVTGLAESSELPAERLAAPEAVLGISLPADLVELALWMSQEYCSTPARALATLLPAGATEPGGGPRRVATASLTEAGREALEPEGSPALSERQRMTLGRLAAAGTIPAAELGHDHIKRLAARGLVSVGERAVTHRPVARAVGAGAGGPEPELTPEQVAAVRQVLAALAGADTGTAGKPGILLHGVTGSGKTEVYLHAVQAALSGGRGAIVLVPEIALTPQSLHRFRSRFGDIVAVLHSALSKAERRDEWARLRTGQARVCVGPRSAVFAPIARIGLIIVDEEHESSYKHEGDPRYDARSVASRRAAAHGAVLVAGTATPRPESAHELRRVRLTRRVDGRALPEVAVLDMRGHHHPLHPETRMALADVRAAQGKAILLLNRRGWSNFLSCRTCGVAAICPRCDVALVLHLAAGTIACHHCGHAEPVPERCGACGSSTLARHGSGTERIEHEIREALGSADFPVFRLDAEAARERDRAAAVLDGFGAARAGVLVGTQVVAKGHDFPDVVLGVALDADATLRFPDFRAEERTFALVTQLAGRAGRSGESGTRARAGRVLVQTVSPEARPIRLAAAHDADSFLAGELARRRALGYPPFRSLVRVVCSAENADDATGAASEVRERIAEDTAGGPAGDRGGGGPDADGTPPLERAAVVLGPAPLFRLRDRHRAQVVVKAADRRRAIAAVGAAVDAVARSRSRRRAGVAISVDVDPQ